MDFFTGGHDAGTLGLGLLIAGAVAGLMAGGFGRGAGLILVPVLYHIAGEMGVAEALRFNLAAGTSLACLLPVTLVIAPQHAKLFDRKSGEFWAFAAAGGTPLGIVLALTAPPLWRAIGIAVIAFAAVVLAFQTEKASSRTMPGGLLGYGIAFGGGAVMSLFGISGLSLFTPLLARLGLEARAAQATAKFIAVLICGAGALQYVWAGWDVPGLPKYSYGFVNLLAFGIAAPVMAATAMFSARYAGMIEAKRTRAAFALIVLALAGRMLWEVMG